MISVYGWGIVAPGAADIGAFQKLVFEGDSVLAPSVGRGLGDGLFLVGDPEFDFAEYRDWFEQRGAGSRFTQLQSKMGDNALFAIGALIQALKANPALERAIQLADEKAHIYVGSGVGDLRETAAAHDDFARASRVWNRFWAHPSRCQALGRYQQEGIRPADGNVPPDPATLEADSEERFEARAAWDTFWSARSERLAEFEARYRQIEAEPVGAEEEMAALNAIRNRQRLHRKLLEEFGCPPPPWDGVDPRLVWAVQNVPAAQMSILLGTHGPAWAPVGACATFGIALKLGCEAIENGSAKIAIVGTTDPRPLPILVSAFHRARLTPASGVLSRPFHQLLGTHIAGGACIWILADDEYMRELGIAPAGPRVAASAVSSDSFHIVTPSPDGPKRAIREALAKAEAKSEQIAAWDMHATGTPGDVAELRLVRDFLGAETAVSARKGLFGHGMANAGGWELTALAMTMAEGRAPAGPLAQSEIHPLARELGVSQIVCDSRPLSGRYGVKVMLGIGGVTACVVLARGSDAEPSA
jgi:3-oxoacyl-[acyl-carrier-protein] synthase II